jgi:hypothetical protein
MNAASTTYGSIVKTFQYLHDIYPETILAPFHLEFPTSHADILSYFRAHLRALPAPAPSAANPAPQRVAVIDALVSAPGALLPWEEMVAICREEGVYSVVDAAHAVGQQTGINLTKSMPDFWVSASLAGLVVRAELTRSCARRIATSGSSQSADARCSTCPSGADAPSLISNLLTRRCTKEPAPHQIDVPNRVRVRQETERARLGCAVRL